MAFRRERRQHVVGFVVAVLLVATGCADESSDDETSGIRHVLMFSWNEDATADDIAATTAAINGLPGEIEAIRSFDHGADLGVSDQQYDYSLVATFDSLDDFAEYRAHPTHVALVEDYIDPFVADRTSVQFGEDRS